MKKLILLLCCTVLAWRGWAAVPVPAISLAPGWSLPMAVSAATELGATMDKIPFIDLGMTWTEHAKMYGVSLALLGSSYGSRMGGVQIAPIGATAGGYAFGVQVSCVTMAEHGGGVQIGGVNIADSGARIQVGAINVADQTYCIQIGAINWANDCRGFQFGLINYADASSKMLQAGGINYNSRNGLWPLLTWSW